MKWKQAVKYMKKGGKVTRKHWLRDDYLYMEGEVLYCDGGFPYLYLLRSLTGEWVKYYD